MLAGIKFNKKPESKDENKSTTQITQALQDELTKKSGDLQPERKRWQKKPTDEPMQIELSRGDTPAATTVAPDEIIDDSKMLCDDFIESFMKGNFSRVARTLEKLDHVKT